MEIRAHADIAAVLSDDRYTVPPVPGHALRGTLQWLRQNVCRFSEGEDHDRRLAIVIEQLAQMDPAALRREAHERATTILKTSPHDRVAAVARAVPTAVLGRALGVTELDTLIKNVPVVAAVYLTGTDQPEAADRAVAILVELLSPGSDEEIANRIAILMQSCEATATLIAKAATRTCADSESTIIDTLRFDPPVPALRRLDPHGIPVTLNITVANLERSPHLTFGAGRRPCPGAHHAVQLAAGVLDALRAKEND
ncbi:cytochrome P450 family protein [Actinomadura rudentiformis]|uniref:Oxidoreductase n=1 Tax=Actinomadura rudentiformis TaxID=359158 RepID=A0A6H9YT86_9ACTN|nr:oxidoreductase [Actinomadura rudentiformis]KAB2348834.1 oxidoreductase [Actinomadura rudentiformis]